MEFTINTASASAVLGYVAAACQNKSPLPILKNILIESDGADKVKFTANNMEIQISASATAEVKDDSPITVEGKKLIDIFKSLPKASNTTIKLDKGKVTVKCGRSRFKLNTLPAQEFPEFSNIGEYNQYEVSGNELKSAFDRCFVAMANQDVRYFLNGMHVALNNGNLDVVATDGHRLNSASLNATGNDIAVTIPRDCVKPVMGVLDCDSATIGISDSSIQVSDGPRTVTVKLIDGKYPDYNRVIPSGNSNEIEFNRMELYSAVSRAALLSNEKFKGIRFQIQNNECAISGSNPEQEESSETIPCSHGGELFEIAFNATYLTDALSSIDTDSVVINFGADGSKSALISDGDFRCVVMPIRL